MGDKVKVKFTKLTVLLDLPFIVTNPTSETQNIKSISGRVMLTSKDGKFNEVATFVNNTNFDILPNKTITIDVEVAGSNIALLLQLYQLLKNNKPTSVQVMGEINTSLGYFDFSKRIPTAL